MERRNFVKTVGMAASAMSLLSLDSLPAKSFINDTKSNDPSNMGTEDFWTWVQESYNVNTNIINLNNGGVSPQPRVVQEAFEHYNRLCNEAPAYYMWRIVDQGREPLRERLAHLGGCSAEEISICRNTTEALDNVIFGLTLKAGDEVILTKQDYPNVINAWKQRAMRDGIVIKWANLNLPMENDDEIVNEYIKQITPSTRIINITHVINWNGQIIPARKIAEEAHKRGIEVMVDAAHSFAHFDFNFYDLGADYLGTSLHKWLCAPFGTGMLFVKKEKIKDLYPLMAPGDPKSPDIRKFESLGTRSFATEQAIGEAINFHTAIGIKRKEARLRYLKNYWAEKVVKFNGVKVNTSLKPEFSCGIAMVSIEGMKPGDVATKLFDKYKIFAVAIEWENIKGVRITPHVYTRIDDLDRFVTAIGEISKNK